MEWVHEVLSFMVFSFLDLVDAVLCVMYKLVDYLLEGEWKPCYCSSSAREMVTGSGNILVSEDGGGSKIVCLYSSKLQLDDVSDTLYSRRSLVSDVSRAAVNELRRVRGGSAATEIRVNSTIIRMLQGKVGKPPPHPVPRWSDCDCTTCNLWSSPSASPDSLFVRAQGAGEEVVLFIHGFISSSAIWTETVFPNIGEGKYKLIAVDLLGFGRSPKPAESLYTLREHVYMIEQSVLAAYKVKKFHIVAHSLGSIIALALAVKYPDAVLSLTLIAPPYFPVPKGEEGTQYVLRRVAPRRLWPALAFGASLVCWYEHISRTVCFLICKNHRLWEFLFKLVTRNRIRTFLLEGFCCHTHNAAWHTMHNIICGTAGRVESYLDDVRENLSCDVTVIHGSDDALLPVECSLAVGHKVPRASVKVVNGMDHITIVVGREKAFARELQGIWENSTKVKQ